MKKVLAAMMGLCCLVAFSSVSMADSEKTKKENKVVQEKQPTVKGEVVNRSGEESAKKKTVNKNIKRSSEHGSVRGTINGGGDPI